MVIMYELAAIGAAAIAVALVWRNMRFNRMVMSVDARLVGMQKEIESQQLRDSPLSAIITRRHVTRTPQGGNQRGQQRGDSHIIPPR